MWGKFSPLKPTDAQTASGADPRLELLRDMLARTGGARVRAHGESMRPFIRHGDVVRVTACEPGDLRRGEVAACAVPHGLIIHRVLSNRRGALRLKGDTFARPDAPVPHDMVLGRITSVETADGIIDLTTPRALAAGRLVLLYMTPVSLALALWRGVTGKNGAPRKKPVSRMRRFIEWLPRAAVQRLIHKNR